MNNTEDISSTILSKVGIIADIYSIIKDAGLRTVASDAVKDAKTNTTIIKANIPGINRTTKNCRFPKTNDKECRISKQYSIDYNAADITIVGGAALNLYDYLLTSFKGRHKMTALEDYIKKKTSDIDIVWWPRSVTNVSTGHQVDNEIVTSSSQAVMQLVYTLRNKIASGLESKKSELQAKLKESVPGAKNTDILKIEVGGDRYEIDKPAHTWKAGSWTIAINFKYANKEFKICEVLVHDSGASQLYDENGNIITDLRYMSHDPIYCSPNQSKSNHISWLNINGVDIGVPNILSFVKQQMLAFSNNMTKYRDEAGKWNFKGFINYKRVEFIKLLLENIKLNDNSNISDLSEVFKTTNTEYPAHIVLQINEIENTNITRLNTNIIQLCEHYDSSNDAIISELCTKAKNSDFKHWITDRVDKLTRLTQVLHNDYKKAPKSEFRRAYSDLERKADNFRLTVQKLSPSDIITHPFYRDDPVKQIETEKSTIDAQLNAFRMKNKSKTQDVRINTSIPKSHPSSMRPVTRDNRGVFGESVYPTPAPISIRHPYENRQLPPLPPSPPPPPPPIPRSHQPIEFNSVYFNTTPTGIKIFKSSDGIYWYIDPVNRKLIRRNPWTGVYEFPEKRHPSYGLGITLSPQGIKFIQDIQHFRVIRLNPFTLEWEGIPYGAHLNYGLPPPSQPISAIPRGYSRMGGRNITNKKRNRNNYTFKK